MNVNEKLSQAIIAAFEAEGLTRLDMVLKLADLLDVRKELYTADEHRERLENVMREDRAYRANETKTIKIGETVMTDRGPAKAIALDAAKRRLLEKLLGVSRGLAA